jgi:hypothetical protein
MSCRFSTETYPKRWLTQVVLQPVLHDVDVHAPAAAEVAAVGRVPEARHRDEVAVREDRPAGIPQRRPPPLRLSCGSAWSCRICGVGFWPGALVVRMRFMVVSFAPSGAWCRSTGFPGTIRRLLMVPGTSSPWGFVVL